jgi:hypothetical protein
MPDTPPENNVPADHAHLDRLIAGKSIATAPTDGRLQVALAIAGISSLVTVDATKNPFQTSPDDLFDLNFDDPSVGISDDQMPAFRANLTVLLPEIASDIAQLRDNASLPIEKVAEFVRLSLLAHNKG